MNRILFFSFFLSAGVSLSAEGISFAEIWKMVETHSYQRKAKTLEAKAGELAKERSDRHWLPRIYTDVRTYHTNDPALNLLGKLGQRQANDADFSTSSSRLRPGNYLDSSNQPYTNLNSDTANIFAKDTLNYPGYNTYSRGSLGLEFSLYEGGSSEAYSKLQEKRSIGLRWEVEAIKDREFANTARYYRGIQSIQEFLARIDQIKKTEARFQSSYQLANRGNPVGYSGYLALKSLKNRLLTMEKESAALLLEFKDSLSVLSGLSAQEISPIPSDLFPFLESEFPYLPNEAQTNVSKAMGAYTEGEILKSDLEMAKFLPKVGLYSEANAYSGARSTQTAYNAGVYVQMNLYSPKELGSVEEAKLNAEAAKQKFADLKEKELHLLKILRARESSLRESYALVKESLKNQEEQVSYMQRLFQSGAITAIQFAEVLNRSADLAKALLDIELNYLSVRTEFHLFQEGKSNESLTRN
ncbi:TolC family protein [Leptospira ryugenii]|nr:TolC family protein [Leptospira ryugenii]